MLQELVDKLVRLRGINAFDMMDVCCKIQIHPTRALVELGNLVTAHRRIGGLDFGEVLWSCQLFGMQDGVRGNIIMSQHINL